MQAESFQNLQIFSFVATMALGGKPKEVKPPENMEQAEMQFNNIFGRKVE